MDSREMTREVRLRQWSEVLREQKESGQNVKTWCESQGIRRQQYFYWQRKLREAACALVRQEETEPPAPTGWSLCAPASSPAVPEVNLVAGSLDQVYIELNGMRILSGRDYPAENLARLLRELAGTC